MSRIATKKYAISIAAGVLVAAVLFCVLQSRKASSPLAQVFAGRGLTQLEMSGGARLEFAHAGEATAGERQQIAQALRQRGNQVGRGTTVVTDRDRVVVSIAGIGAKDAQRMGHSFGGRGFLQFKMVAENTPYMRTLYRFVQDDNAAHGLGVAASTDGWEHDKSGRQYQDYFLRAADPKVITAYLKQLPPPPPGFEIGFEYIVVTRRGASSFWRTHLMQSATELDNRHIDKALVVFNPTTNMPEVLITFTKDGAKKFGEVTAANMGRRLAIMVNGFVNSAPVIQAAIYGGRSTITMGGTNVRAVEAEAYSLAASLVHDPLPYAMTFMSAHAVPPSVSATTIVLGDLALALLLGLGIGFLVFGLERKSQAIDPAIERPETRVSSVWIRLAVTVAGIAAVYFSTRLRLPTVDQEAVESMAVGMYQMPSFSVFLLGIFPLLSAFLIVEFAALVVPSWRSLRIGGPKGRATLAVAVAVVALVLALIQGLFVARWLNQLGLDYLDTGMLRTDTPSPVLVTTITLAAGTMVYALIAGLINRYGLGSGYSILILAGFASEGRHIVRALRSAESGYMSATTLALFVGTLAAVVAATSWLLRKRVGDGELSVQLPTCGLLPLVCAPALVAVASALTTAGILGPTTTWPGDINPATTQYVITYALVAVVLALMFSALFSWPRLLGRVRAVVSKVDATPPQRLFWLATAVSVGFIAVLSIVYVSMVKWTPILLIDLAIVVTVTAIVMDLIAAWRAFSRRGDLVAVWPIHRVQCAGIAVHALRGAGIPAHARGLYHRSLLFFFGPFIPIAIMVPQELAEDACDVLQAVLGSDTER